MGEAFGGDVGGAGFFGDLAEIGGEVRLALGDCFDGGDQVAVGVGLEDVAERAGLHDGLEQSCRVVERQDDGFWGKQAAPEFAQSINTAQAGHVQVHHHGVRSMFFRQRDGLGSGLGFGADGPACMPLEDRLDPVADYVVVICDKNANGIAPGCGRFSLARRTEARLGEVCDWNTGRPQASRMRRTCAIG